MLTFQEILLYYSLKHHGNWDAIYDCLKRKERIEESIARELIENCHESYFTLIDDLYPVSLKNVSKPPFVLFYRGRIELLNLSPRLAIIGSRNASSYGKKAAKKIVKELIEEEEVVIVSGMARGIDAIAHQTALEEDGYTIAVLGTGIDYCYPQENENLYKRLNEEGLILSEYPPQNAYVKDSFPMRNRIIAGLAAGIVVIEAKPKSGTISTINYGLESGRDIFCVPSSIFDNSICNRLIKEGAILICSGHEILSEFH